MEVDLTEEPLLSAGTGTEGLPNGRRRSRDPETVGTSFHSIILGADAFPLSWRTVLLFRACCCWVFSAAGPAPSLRFSIGAEA